MNAPTMPGFTAETAVYRTIRHYRGVSAFGHAGDTLRAAQFGVDRSCVDRCIDECIQGENNPFIATELLRQECRPGCETGCGFGPQPCPPDKPEFCWRLGNRALC